jgi:DNA-3-methyladenine glycosylase I
MPISTDLSRCRWCGDDPLYVCYHDEEWGVPCRDERTLFEFLILEGAQAGLSWITVLRKRENYRRAFAEFDAEAIARFGDADIARLMNDPGIVRNRAKISAAIDNARATCRLHDEGQSLRDLFWGMVDDQPVINHWRDPSELPVFTPTATALSKELKRLGFRFVGPTVIYSHMQATGMVNDHLVSCFRHAEVR